MTDSSLDKNGFLRETYLFFPIFLNLGIYGLLVCLQVMYAIQIPSSKYT